MRAKGVAQLHNLVEKQWERSLRFSSDASHQLKTPLTIMRGEIESALRSEVDDRGIEGLLDGLVRRHFWYHLRLARSHGGNGVYRAMHQAFARVVPMQ